MTWEPMVSAHWYWPAVAFALGVLSLGVVVYALQLWRSMRANDETVAGIRTECAELRAARDGLSQRVAKVETALRIDGARVMNEAMKASLPNFMR